MWRRAPPHRGTRRSCARRLRREMEKIVRKLHGGRLRVERVRTGRAAVARRPEKCRAIGAPRCGGDEHGGRVASVMPRRRRRGRVGGAHSSFVVGHVRCGRTVRYVLSTPSTPCERFPEPLVGREKKKSSAGCRLLFLPLPQGQPSWARRAGGGAVSRVPPSEPSADPPRARIWLGLGECVNREPREPRPRWQRVPRVTPPA